MWKVRIVSVDVPDPPEVNVTLLELRLILGPLGEETAEKDTVPVKPTMLVRLTFMVPVEPAATVSDVGFAARLKS